MQTQHLSLKSYNVGYDTINVTGHKWTVGYKTNYVAYFRALLILEFDQQQSFRCKKKTMTIFIIIYNLTSEASQKHFEKSALCMEWLNKILMIIKCRLFKYFKISYLLADAVATDVDLGRESSGRVSFSKIKTNNIENQPKPWSVFADYWYWIDL